MPVQLDLKTPEERMEGLWDEDSETDAWPPRFKLSCDERAATEKY